MAIVPVVRLYAKPYIERAKLSDKLLSDEEIGRYIKAALRSSCELVRDYAKTHHRYRDISENLTNSIKYSVSLGTRSKNMEKWYGKVGYIKKGERPEYAKWQLYGTGLYNKEKPHYIRPRYKKVMHFMGERGKYEDKYFYLRQSEGIKGQDYLRNALVKNRAKINMIFEKGLEMLIKHKKG